MGKRIFKWLGRILLGIVASVALYFSAALIGGAIVLNSQRTPLAEGIPVYLVSNGVHVDVVLPVTADCPCDRGHAPPLSVLRQTFDARAVRSQWHWLAVGWGDRQFMLGVPTWADLTPGVAFKAVSGLDGSVIRLSSVSGEPAPAPDVVRVLVSAREYRALLDYVLDSAGTPREVAARIAGPEDRFYVSGDHYSLFNTCNEWVSRGLAKAGIRTPLWSPFQGALLRNAAR